MEKVRGLELVKGQVKVSKESERGSVSREKIEECVHFFRKMS